MRFQTTPQFDTDYRRLPREHQAMFRGTIPAFNAAVEAYVASNGASGWPRTLRVKPMKSVRGVWELTWHFTSPDGRATWELVQDDDGPLVRWRRIGDHSIYDRP